MAPATATSAARCTLSPQAPTTVSTSLPSRPSNRGIRSEEGHFPDAVINAWQDAGLRRVHQVEVVLPRHGR